MSYVVINRDYEYEHISPLVPCLASAGALSVQPGSLLSSKFDLIDWDCDGNTSSPSLPLEPSS